MLTSKTHRNKGRVSLPPSGAPTSASEWLNQAHPGPSLRFFGRLGPEWRVSSGRCWKAGEDEPLRCQTWDNIVYAKERLKIRISGNSKLSDPRDYNERIAPRLSEAGRALIKENITCSRIPETADCRPGGRAEEQVDSADTWGKPSQSLCSFQ